MKTQTTRTCWILIFTISFFTLPLFAAQSNIIWIEGEAAASIPEGLAGRTLDKFPASGQKSLIGKAFAKKGNKINYTVTLPAAMDDAYITFRYSRLQVMRWTEAEASITVTGPSTKITRDEKWPQSHGWGTLSGKEWTLHAVSIGDLPAGQYNIEIAVQKDNSDLNLDGFFLSPGPLPITIEDFAACCSTDITSKGFIGLQIVNTAIDQRHFQSINIVGKGFTSEQVLLNANLLDQNGDIHTTIFKNRAICLCLQSQIIEISPRDLAGLTDGNYTLKVSWDNGNKSVSSPLVVMGDLLATAAAKAEEYEQYATALDENHPDVAQRVKGDLMYAVDYIRNTLVLLKSRDGQFDANDSVHKRALSYFEKAVQRTAANFSADLRGIIAQTDETITRINQGNDPYLNRSGDLRRAFYSDFSGQLEPYRVLIPESYWQASEYKFLLALHGAGGDENYYPENDKGSFAKAASELQYIVAAPKANLRYRNGGEKDMKQLVELMVVEYPAIRADQLFCTGVSMGGGGTYRMTCTYPDLFRAAAIVSSGLRGEPRPDFDNLKSTPILILHGKQDGVSSVENAYRMAEELKKRGFTYEIEVYPTYGHAYYGAEYLYRTDQFFQKFK